MATGEKKRKKVYCSTCAYLFLLKGIAPICIASCKFVHGPLRKVIYITGILSAEKRNKYNNCKFFKRFDLTVLKKRKWVRKRFQLEGLNLEKLSISHYTLKSERLRKESFIHGKKGKEKIDDGAGHAELGYAGKRLEELKEELQGKDGEDNKDSRRSASSTKDESFFDKLTDKEKRNVVTGE